MQNDYKIFYSVIFVGTESFQIFTVHYPLNTNRKMNKHLAYSTYSEGLVNVYFKSSILAVPVYL